LKIVYSRQKVVHQLILKKF